MAGHYCQFGRVSVLVLAAAVLAGCTARYHRRSADKETYRILQEVDNRVFGKTNDFTINTRYSSRDPKAIPPAEIIDDRMATNRRVLDLDQALDLAVLNSREYQFQKEQLYLAALSLTGARYEFTPQATLSSSPQIAGNGSFVPYTVVTPSGTNTFLRWERTEYGSVNSRFQVSMLLRTGGKLTVALLNDLVHYFVRSPVAARGSTLSVLSVDLAQPLLRGFGANDPTVENLTQTERDVVYAVRTFSRYQQQFAVDTVTAYFGLLTQKDLVRNYYRNYTNRIETTKYLEARAVDRQRESDVDDARTAELTAKRDYIDALASYLSDMDAFKLRLGIPIGEALYLDDRDLKEMINTGLISVELDKERAFRVCLEKQMEVLNAIDSFEDSKRKVRVARDQLRGDVNLFATADVDSEGDWDYVNFDPAKVRYSAGVQVNFPIDRIPERNTYRATLVSFERQLRTLSLTLDNYKDRIDRGLRNLEQRRLNYLNGVESLKVVQRRVENNVLLLEAGRATIRDLREAQDALIQAENNLAVLYASHLAARLNLLLDMGIIEIEPDKFWLMDPLKDKVSPAQRGTPPLRMPDDRVLPPELFLEPAS